MSLRNSMANFKWKRLFWGIGGVVLLVLFIIFYFNFLAVYSEGNRAGTLIKFSKKGWLMKTYEGELNQGGIANPVPGTALVNQIWKFSVKNNAVAEELMKLEGKVVRLHYRQYNRMLPWEGETQYLVNDVEIVE